MHFNWKFYGVLVGGILVTNALYGWLITALGTTASPIASGIPAFLVSTALLAIIVTWAIHKFHATPS